MVENLVALGKRLAAPDAGRPYCSLSMPATKGVIRLVSVAATLITAVASEFALIRPAVAGTPSASQFGGYLSTVTNGNAISQINTAWNTSAAVVWQVDISTGPTFVNQTAGFNDPTDANWTVFPAVEANGDYAAIGFANPFSGLVIDYANGTAGVGGTVTWKYWNGAAWAALAGVTDGTVGFTAAVGDGYMVTWTVPANWATTSLNGSAQLYYVIAEVTGVYATNPICDQGFVLAIPTIAATPKYLAKAFLPATIGSSFVWDFNDIVDAQGKPIPFVVGGYSASSDELELLLWNTGAGAGGIIDVTWTWKE